MECILPAFDKMAFSVDGPKGTVAASGGSLGAKAPLSAGCGMLPGKALPRWERPTNITYTEVRQHSSARAIDGMESLF